MNTADNHNSKTTNGLALALLVFILAMAATIYTRGFGLFSPMPPTVEEESPPAEEVIPAPSPPVFKIPPTKLVVEPPPLAPGDDGSEEKLRDVSWTAYGGEHIAYINRLYTYSLGYDIGGIIALPPRTYYSERVNADGKNMMTMSLMTDDRMSDPDVLHLRQLFYDGYARRVGERMHMQAEAHCDVGGCGLTLTAQ